MNKRILILLPLIIGLGIFVPAIPKAHALTGIVCITFPSTSASCPASSPAIGPITPGQNFTVGVFVQGSDAMGGFDVFVQNDPTFVNARVAALGTLIVTPSLTSICINGLAQTGACTAGSANGPGVVEVTTIESSGGNECGGIGPCSGLAFTITYTAVASTASTPLTYPINPGCSNSSVASPPNVCVLVADAFGTTLAESAQAATISTQAAAATQLVSVVSGTDGNLYFSPYNGAWGAWTALAGQTPSSPALCASGTSTAELLVRGTDNSIYHKTFTSGTPGSFAATWDKNPTGVTVDSPVCAVIGTTLYVVVRGATGELFFTTFDLAAHTWAATWTDLLGSSPSTPALAGTPASTRLDLVVRGGDNQIYHKAFTSGTWAPAWDTSNRLPVPDKTIATPAIVSDGSTLHVVVIGTESNIWYATRSFTGTWSTYTSLAGSTSVTPSLVVDASGNLHLAVRGFDAQLYSKSKPSGGAWDAAWVNAGGVLANSSPAAVTFGTSTAVIVQGSNNGLYYNTLTGSAWSGYVFMNGQASRSAGLSTP